MTNASSKYNPIISSFFPSLHKTKPMTKQIKSNKNNNQNKYQEYSKEQQIYHNFKKWTNLLFTNKGIKLKIKQKEL